MKVQSNFPQETSKMPWFGSRLQAVVDFLLVADQRAEYARARENHRRGTEVAEAFEYLLSGKMWDYSLSWGMEAHERFQLQCSDWVNCFWHLNGCW